MNALQVSPFQASMPSRIGKMAMTRPAIGSAHHQPKSVLSRRPTSTAAEMLVQISVCLESATAVAEPSSRPARRSAKDRNGMTVTL